MEPKTENLRNWLLDLEPHPFLEKSTSFAGGSVLSFLIAHHVGFVSEAGGVAQKGLVKLVSSIKRVKYVLETDKQSLLRLTGSDSCPL